MDLSNPELLCSGSHKVVKRQNSEHSCTTINVVENTKSGGEDKKKERENQRGYYERNMSREDTVAFCK